MRVVLVGPPAARARLLASFPDGLEVVGEARTLADARNLPLAADAWLVATATGTTESTRSRRAADRARARGAGTSRAGPAQQVHRRRLGISDQTVKFHVASICGKLGAANRTDAARRALRQGIIPL